MNKHLSVVAISFALLARSFGADEPQPKLPGDAVSAKPRTVEERFQDADVSLAIAQYEKLRMTEFELRLQLQLDAPSNAAKREELAKRVEILHQQAAVLREETIKRAATAAR